MKNALQIEIKELLNELLKEPLKYFSDNDTISKLTIAQGVYIIYQDKSILHVGRTYRAKQGIKQRIKNHLYGNSSFMKYFDKMNKEKLKKYCTFKYIEVKSDRKRALLEFLAIGILCPEYLGEHRGKKENI